MRSEEGLPDPVFGHAATIPDLMAVGNQRPTFCPSTLTCSVAFGSAPKIGMENFAASGPEKTRQADDLARSDGKIDFLDPAGRGKPLDLQHGLGRSRGIDERSTWSNASPADNGDDQNSFVEGLPRLVQNGNAVPQHSDVLAKLQTSSRKCEMNRMDVPCESRSRRMAENTNDRSASDSDAVGSSMMKETGVGSKRLKNETICRRPIGRSSTIVSGSIS